MLYVGVKLVLQGAADVVKVPNFLLAFHEFLCGGVLSVGSRQHLVLRLARMRVKFFVVLTAVLSLQHAPPQKARTKKVCTSTIK